MARKADPPPSKRGRKTDLSHPIAAARVAAGLTQEQAAAKAGCSQPQWCDLEGGRYADPRLSTYRLIAKALGVDVALAIIREALAE